MPKQKRVKIEEREFTSPNPMRHPILYFSPDMRERRATVRELRDTYFDEAALGERNITFEDIVSVRRYVLRIQSHLVRDKTDLWNSEIRKGGEIGTQRLIHEVKELRGLSSRGVDVFKLPPEELSRTLEANKGAHLEGLMAEYQYWRTKNPRKDLSEFIKTITTPEDVESFTEEYLKRQQQPR